MKYVYVQMGSNCIEIKDENYQTIAEIISNENDLEDVHYKNAILIVKALNNYEEING